MMEVQEHAATPLVFRLSSAVASVSSSSGPGKEFCFGACFPVTRLLKGGVVIDCARHEAGQHPMDDGTWWLHLYVMLSRATSSENLLLIRAPGLDFLTRGPPADLAARLRTFNSRTRACRAAAEKLARKLGLAAFLHD